MVVGRLPHPGSELAATRGRHTTTPARELDLGDADEDGPYEAMDWPFARREGVVAVDGVGAGGDLVGGEGLDRGAQHVDGVAEAEIERGQGVGSHEGDPLS